MMASVIKHIRVAYQSYNSFLSKKYMILKGSEMFDTEHSYVFHLNIILFLKESMMIAVLSKGRCGECVEVLRG